MIRNKKGVTAIELIGTVAIIGLLSSMAVPSVNNVILQFRLKQTAREIASNLKLLRIRAIATNSDTYLDLTPEGISLDEGFYTAFVEENNDLENITTSETDTTNLLLNDTHDGLEGKRLPNGVRFKSTNFGNQRAVFQPNGIPLNGGNIILENTLGEQYRVIVAGFTGRIRIER